MSPPTGSSCGGDGTRTRGGIRGEIGKGNVMTGIGGDGEILLDFERERYSYNQCQKVKTF